MLGIHRSGFYYAPEGESELNLDLMKTDRQILSWTSS